MEAERLCHFSHAPKFRARTHRLIGPPERSEPCQRGGWELAEIGRLEQVEQFEQIILRGKPDGSVVRIEDVARVELGADEYDW